MADGDVAMANDIHQGKVSPAPSDVAETIAAEKTTATVQVVNEIKAITPKEKTTCDDIDTLSVPEHPVSKWAIGSENNSEDETESQVTENASWKQLDHPVSDRKSIEDAASCASDSTTELDIAPLTKKPRPRPIETLTEGEVTPIKRNSLHVSGWESDDSDARHRSDSNASSQPLLSRKHASSTERMLLTATSDGQQTEKSVSDEHAVDTGEKDGPVTSTPKTTVQDAVAAANAGDAVQTNGIGTTQAGDTPTNLVVSNGESKPDEVAKPTLRRVPTATLLISEHGIDVVPQTVTTPDDVLTSMQVVKQMSYRPPMPDNYLVLSCIVMFCCNPFFGIVAFIFSVCTSKSYERRDYRRAKKQSKMALWFALTGVIATFTIIIVLLVVYWPRQQRKL